MARSWCSYDPQAGQSRNVLARIAQLTAKNFRRMLTQHRRARDRESRTTFEPGRNARICPFTGGRMLDLLEKAPVDELVQALDFVHRAHLAHRDAPLLGFVKNLVASFRARPRGQARNQLLRAL